MSRIDLDKQAGGASVRKFRPEDRGQVIALWKSVFPDDPPHNAPDSMLSSKLGVDDLVFVAEVDNRIVGACMAGYDGHRGWLYAVGVLPGYRGTGTGRAMVQYVSAALQELGCMKINIQIRVGNTEVIEFYRRMGFRMEERTSMGIFLDR